MAKYLVTYTQGNIIMPSRSTLMGIAWALAAIAVVSRIPQARAVVFGS